ncbi:transcription elongation factor GreA [Microlunatus ginsengisoli]|uniref:Transcription elongation factor GreA n=2 Tax=Microlunatus ginsengisoli TaxID=363863 RepID=A0ABP7ATN3_9ACTN
MHVGLAATGVRTLTQVGPRCYAGRMSETEQQVIWLTQEAYQKLSDELDQLSGPGRAEVSAKIAQAREEGDLRENGGYHAAREEQGQQEARIRQLTDMLRRAQVGEAPANADEVAPGTQVTIAFDGDESDTDTFVLGSRELLGLDASVDTNVYSPQSPLGAAILGKKKGDAVSYVAPNGKSIDVTVVKVEPFPSA